MASAPPRTLASCARRGGEWAAVSLGMAREHAVDQVDDVTDRSDIAQVALFDARSGQLLDSHGEVDRVDAVEIEVFAQKRFFAYRRGIELEHFGDPPSYF